MSVECLHDRQVNEMSEACVESHSACVFAHFAK